MRNFRAYFLINTKFLIFLFVSIYLVCEAEIRSWKKNKTSIKNDNLQLEIHSLQPA